ncbi:MAG: hypothetical protein Q7O66_05950 [Dehalococcoidia bacterium]|nr:hypothetical protein [Dehalococcoidia bacterium]
MTLNLSDLLTPAGVAIVVLILIQVSKKWISEDLVPACALAVGMAVAIAAQLVLGPVTGVAIATAALGGFLGGAAASGVYKAQAPIGLLASKVPDATPHG